MADQERKVWYEITSRATNRQFLTISEALNIDRIVFQISDYDKSAPSGGRQKQAVSAYLNTDRTFVLLNKVLDVGITDEDRHNGGWKLESFGGGKGAKGIESRIFVVSYDPGEGAKFAANPWRFAISIGPGRTNSTGAIQPEGPPTSRGQFRLSEADMVSVCTHIRLYIATEYHRVIECRREEQRTRFQERQEKQAHQPAKAYASPPSEPTSKIPLPVQFLTYRPGTLMHDIKSGDLNHMINTGIAVMYKQEAQRILRARGEL